MEFIHNYQHYFSQPDGVNSIFSVFPGTGSVLGGDGTTGSIYRNNFTFALAERWTIKSNLINEIRLTSSGNGTSNFRREFAQAISSSSAASRSATRSAPVQHLHRHLAPQHAGQDDQ